MNSLPTRRPFINSLLRFLFVIIAISPLGYTVYKEWPAFQSSITEVEWGSLIYAQILFFIIILLKGIIPWISLKHLGVSFSLAKATAVYFLSQILKYLPGGIWAFPGRMAIYQFLGVERAKSVVSVFREMTAEFLGAAVIGIFGLMTGLQLSIPVRNAIVVGIIVSVVAILFTHMQWFWNVISSVKMFGSSPIASYGVINQQERGVAWILRTMIIAIIFWALLGLPIRQIVIAVHPMAESITWIEAASMFALAWCAGFVVVLIPAGIGVREGVLTLLLSNVIPVGPALTIALMSRVAWIIAEGLWIFVTLIWSSRGTGISWVAIRRMSGSQSR